MGFDYEKDTPEGSVRNGGRRHAMSAACTASAAYSAAHRRAEAARGRVVASAGDLAAVASADALAVLAAMGGRPVAAADLARGELAGLVPDPGATVARLRWAGLLEVSAGGSPAVALTPRGREVWMAVRSLCQ